MAQAPGEAFDRLVSLVARLRAPDGCPWDREQTLESLRAFVLEEAYEVLEAIDRGDRRALREEIGDFIFEGVLLAQLCAEAGDFTVADSLASIADKLVRRHPHVFGGAERARTAEEVLGRWEEAKARERAAETAKDAPPKSVLGGVPRSLPALLRAYEMSTRAASVGFDWERASDVLDKIEEEVAELREAVEGRWAEGGTTAGPEGGTGLPRRSSPGGEWRRVEEEMGDLLFALANLARKLGVEPEAALRRADDKFARRFAAMERRMAARGQSLQEAGLARLEEEWGLIKDEE
ncbi:MAG: Protein mazG [Acidobacteria bacterium]|nr:Protein mazG [Acidobacteriota bacterium]